LKARDEGTELAEGVTEPKEAADYAVVFVLDREFAIANRFGENVRHSALRAVQQHLKNGLMPSDRLVRWKGAAFLASLKRVGSVPDVRAELASLGSISAPQVISVDNRSIRLPISLSWAVFPQAQFASLDLLFERVDEFIARAQVSRAK
jgi:GGDEF domain-containing protein